jgi:hypothetical protein
MFTLAPATRWGYFVYPIGLVGWMILNRSPGAGPGALDNGGTVAIAVPAQAASRA